MALPISIVIVNFYSESLIAEIIQELPLTEFEYVIVDNSGTFPSSKNMRNIKLVTPDSNLGFAGGVNLGIQEISREFALIMNPDVVISYESVLKLLAIANTAPYLGCIAPTLIEEKHSGPFINGGKMPTLWPTFCHYFFLSRLSRYLEVMSGIYAVKNRNKDNRIERVQWVSGALILIPTPVLKSLDGFCRDWFMYSEDLEMCLRISRMGKNVFIAPSISGLHIGQASDTRIESKESGHRRHVKTLWLENLSDFHFRYLANSSKSKHLLWCFIVSTGFLFRGLIEFFTLIYRRSLLKSYQTDRFFEYITWGVFAARMGLKTLKIKYFMQKDD